MRKKQRLLFSTLQKRIEEPRKFIQFILGPRQVGKTTLAQQIEKELKISTLFISADTATLEDLTWLQTQWERARQEKVQLFIIDEVQKIPHWSSLIKKLWDEDTRHQRDLKVLILGSSPWFMQKGLTESLAGRFEIIPATHWNFSEMEKQFDFSLDEYIYYGGYPGPASLVKSGDEDRWKNYINDSLIETTISRDILLMTQVNKPILLRRLFQLGCLYSGQILSYQKMLGQLQDKGNTVTIAHYLELLGGANVITGISKFSMQPARIRGSSPKLQVYNSALLSAQLSKSFNEAKKDRALWGRLVESTIGAYLINAIRGSQIELFYWREKNQEVDFVLKKGEKIVAIEVKSGLKKEALPGMDAFVEAFQPYRTLVVGENGISLKKFLTSPIEELFS